MTKALIYKKIKTKKVEKLSIQKNKKINFSGLKNIPLPVPAILKYFKVPAKV